MKYINKGGKKKSYKKSRKTHKKSRKSRKNKNKIYNFFNNLIDKPKGVILM